MIRWLVCHGCNMSAYSSQLAPDADGSVSSNVAILRTLFSRIPISRDRLLTSGCLTFDTYYRRCGDVVAQLVSKLSDEI